MGKERIYSAGRLRWGNRGLVWSEDEYYSGTKQAVDLGWVGSVTSGLEINTSEPATANEDGKSCVVHMANVRGRQRREQISTARLILVMDSWVGMVVESRIMRPAGRHSWEAYTASAQALLKHFSPTL